MDIAQGPFCVEIYRKNAAHPRPHLDLHGPLFTLTVRTPSVWPHCLGKHVIWRLEGTWGAPKVGSNHL